MKLLSTIFCTVGLVIVTGCNYSYNMQRASARSGGDLGMTAVVDQIDPTSQEQLAQYNAFVDEIIVLLNSGKVGTMTQAQLAEQINKIVPATYSNYTASLLSVVANLNIPVDSVLPEKAVVLMTDFCNGSKTALNSYTLGMNTKSE